MTVQVRPPFRMAQVPIHPDWAFRQSDAICRVGALAATVLATPRADYRGAMLAYLFRRFGYPINGWDGQKSLVWYFLTTPDPAVLLWVDPAAAVHLSFGYGTAGPLSQEIQAALLLQTTDLPGSAAAQQALARRVARALRPRLRDLLRPVTIRSTAINILGGVPDDSPWARRAGAEPSHQAGYGLGDFEPTAMDTADGKDE